MLKTNRVYSRNLAQHLILARKRNFNFQSGKFDFSKKKATATTTTNKQTNKQTKPSQINKKFLIHVFLFGL